MRVALDTNAWIAFLNDTPVGLADRVEALIEAGQATMLPMVLAELLSDPGPRPWEETFASIPSAEITDGYWQRSGNLRASLLRRGLRPKMMDTLIAQMCIDHQMALLTVDRDFSPFAEHGGLKLV